ncbi:Hypothetical predicted protein, partial [Paramuricea clavata]
LLIASFNRLNGQAMLGGRRLLKNIIIKLNIYMQTHVRNWIFLRNSSQDLCITPHLDIFPGSLFIELRIILFGKSGRWNAGVYFIYDKTAFHLKICEEIKININIRLSKQKSSRIRRHLQLHRINFRLYCRLAAGSTQGLRKRPLSSRHFQMPARCCLQQLQRNQQISFFAEGPPPVTAHGVGARNGTDGITKPEEVTTKPAVIAQSGQITENYSDNDGVSRGPRGHKQRGGRIDRKTSNTIFSTTTTQHMFFKHAVCGPQDRYPMGIYVPAFRIGQRYIIDGINNRNTVTSCDTYSSTPRVVGICGKLPEIPTESSSISRIPGFSNKFESPKPPNNNLRSPQCLEWKGSVERASNVDHRDRCINNRLGSSLWANTNQGPLVPNRALVTHKLSGTTCRGVRSQIISKEQMQYPCFVAHGQHVSHKLHKQNGWLNIVSPIQPRLRPLAMVSRTLNHGRGTPFSRETEHSSRLRIPSWSRFQRLATGSSCVSENQLQMGSFFSRSFCNKTDSATAKNCELETRSSGRGSGCLYTGLVPTRRVCFPSICPNRALSKIFKKTVNITVATIHFGGRMQFQRSTDEYSKLSVRRKTSLKLQIRSLTEPID